MKLFLAVLMVLTMAGISSAQNQSSTEFIFINGDIYIGAPSAGGVIFSTFNKSQTPPPMPPPIHGRAQAIAVAGRKASMHSKLALIQKLECKSSCSIFGTIILF